MKENEKAYKTEGPRGPGDRVIRVKTGSPRRRLRVVPHIPGVIRFFLDVIHDTPFLPLLLTLVVLWLGFSLGVYLVENGKIRVYSGSENKGVTFSKLRVIARKLYENFDAKYVVYRDLRGRKLVVTPGIKFGCDFAIYEHGPGVDHAPYMVSVRKAKDEISATDIVNAGRLATTVRKRFIIAIPDLEAKDIRYLIFKWFKA